MADKYGKALTFQEERARDKARQRYAVAQRNAALTAIDERFQKMRDDAKNEHLENLKELKAQANAAGVDREKQKQVSDLIKRENKSYEIKDSNIVSAHRQAKESAGDLSQYNGSQKNIDAYAQKIADEKAQKAQARQQTVDNVKEKARDAAGSVKDQFGLGGYFDKKDYNLVQTTRDPNDPFKDFNKDEKQGNPFSGNLMDNRVDDRLKLTDEQKEEQGKTRKEQEEKDAQDAQKRSGGGAFDSQSLQHNVDEEGNATFTGKNKNPDLVLHPALEAVDRMDRPKDNTWGDVFGLGGYFANRFKDDKDPMNRSGHLRRQAEMHDIEAGDHQRSMQANNQIANRDYRGEAEKNAASQAAAENAQKVHNLGNAGAGAAALERDVKAADYNTHMQRSDQQRSEGVKNMEKMHDDRQVAEEERSGADVYDYTARDMNDYNARSDWLSMGGPSFSIGKKKERPEKKPGVEEGKTDYPPQTESASAIDTAAAQDVINEFVGASLNDELNGHKELDSGGQELFASMSEKYPSLKPIPSWPTSTRENYYKNLGVDVSMSNKDPNKWMKATSAWSNSDDEYGSSKDKKALLGELQVQRSETGDASETRAEGQGGTFARRNIDDGQLGDVVKQGQEQQ